MRSLGNTIDKVESHTVFIGEETTDFSKLLANVDVELMSRAGLDKAAKDFRLTVSRTLFNDGAFKTPMQAVAANSIFGEHYQFLNHPQPDNLISFNLWVSLACVWSVLKSKKSTLFKLVFSSKIVEQSGYFLIDPWNMFEPKIYLGAAKYSGFFFTPYAIADEMASMVIGSRRSVERVIDPAAGSGMLLGALMLRASHQSISIGEITAIERDPFTAQLLREILVQVAKEFGCDCRINVINEDTLKMFEEQRLQESGFDCVLMNPPYGRVKFLRDILINAETATSTSKYSLDYQAEFWKNHTSAALAKLRVLARELGLAEGRLDFQRLFVALASRLLADNGVCTFIAPSTWLGDKDGLTLRKKFVLEKRLRRLVYVPEKARVFSTVNQPTAIVTFDTGCVSVEGDSTSFLYETTVDSSLQRRGVPCEIKFSAVEKGDPELLRIPRIGVDRLETFQKLSNLAKLGAQPWLDNSRGEVDLTLLEKMIIVEESEIRLIRGDHVERYVLRPASYSKSPSFVDPALYRQFLVGRKKSLLDSRPRLACRQCAYLSKQRRLSFVVVPDSVALANSCNYISLKSSLDASNFFMGLTIDDVLHALSCLLNSVVVEWYFRVYSSTNHVANYELNCLPFVDFNAKNASVWAALAVCGRNLHFAYKGTTDGGRQASVLENLADCIVASAMGLSYDEFRHCLADIGDERCKDIEGLFHYVSGGRLHKGILAGDGWHQHTEPSLSGLDRIMIQHIPIGGNWQDIPESVPSKRLEQIRQMSKERGIVRTTYYGRLRPDQPAYTISTYYNRPGNGTNIHPFEHRTLTHREAARIQSFPDWYLFHGSDASIRRQIGNAVPPLLAYALGKHLRDYVSGLPVVDVFCGAGGLSLGLELAGLEVAHAVDLDRDSLETYSMNRGRASRGTLHFNLIESREFNEFIDTVKKRTGGQGIGAIVGGPPCQGFSHAGWRRNDDRRNNLAAIFLDIVREFLPPVVLIENVEGILTMDGGAVIRDLARALRELDYGVCGPWILHSEQFGVPQMRRRVFLVGIRGLVSPLHPPEPLFEKCLGRRERALKESSLFPSLPPPFNVSDALGSMPMLTDVANVRWHRATLGTAFDLWSKGLITTEQLLCQHTC